MGFGPVIESFGEDCSLNHPFSWMPDPETYESKMVHTLLENLEPVRVYVRFQTSRPDEKEISDLEKNIETCEQFLSMAKTNQITMNRCTELLRDASIKRLCKLAGPCFRLKVAMLSPYKIDSSLVDIMGSSLTVSDSTVPFEGGYTWFQTCPESIFDKTILNDKNVFTIGEAACAFRFPDPPLENEYGLPVRNYRTVLAKLPMTDYKKNSIVLFDNEHQHYRQPVIMPPEDRLRHCFIIGQTGMGKSHLMTGMICQDIQMGRGVAVIDPHGDLVDDVLARIPKKRIKDVPDGIESHDKQVKIRHVVKRDLLIWVHGVKFAGYVLVKSLKYLKRNG